MEEVAVDLQGLVGGDGVLEEDDAVVHAHQTVLLAVGHKDGVGEGLHALGEPGLAGLQGVDQTDGVGFLVVGILAVPVHHFRYGADTAAQLVGQLDLGIQTCGSTGEEADGIADSGAGGNNAPELLAGILGAKQGNGKAAHGMAQQIHRHVGIFSDGHIHNDVGIVQDLVVVVVVGQLALGTAVASMVKAVSAVTGGLEFFDKVVIAALVFAQTMDDDNHCLAVGGNFLLYIQLGTVKGRNHGFNHKRASLYYIR